MKAVTAIVNIQIPAGQAVGKPPLGPVLGQRGVNINEFCKQFNAHTAQMTPGMPLPTVITIHADKSFTFKTNQPTVTYFIKQAAGITSGTKDKRAGMVGKITKDDVKNIAMRKMQDSNAFNLEAMERMIVGSANSIGVEVV